MKPTKHNLQHIPRTPGVYMFSDKNGVIIYVGKAVDLKRRVSSYFATGFKDNLKTAHLVSRIAKFETIQTASEFEALLLEARIIRDFLPKYNIIARDDKSPLYIGITDEKLPRIYFAR